MDDLTIKQLKSAWRVFQKWLVIIRYGGACACCGESLTLALTLDHVNGGGTREGRSKNWRRAVQEGFPARFQLLCLSCNQAKADSRECPHQWLRRLASELGTT